MASAEKMPAYLWWDANGASCLELPRAASSCLDLVLAQPASASTCERINSEFAFIKDRRRNRLQHDKANKLLAIFHNLRLLARMNKPNYVEPAVGWNCERPVIDVHLHGVEMGCRLQHNRAQARSCDAVDLAITLRASR